MFVCIKVIYFLSVHEWKEFCNSCNLIGSSNRQNFSILPTNLGEVVARPGPFSCGKNENVFHRPRLVHIGKNRW